MRIETFDLNIPAFLEYSEARHEYYSDGRMLPSVTTILDHAGFISQFCKDDEAADRGTKVHALCATDDVTMIDLRRVPRNLKGYLLAWRKYRRDSGFTPTLIEHRVDSSLGFAGRFDRLGTRPGQSLLTLLDIKTSKSGAIADYVRLQLAAYALALDPTKVFERMAVALKPDGTYNTRSFPLWKHTADRAEWLGILRQHKEKNGYPSQ